MVVVRELIKKQNRAKQEDEQLTNAPQQKTLSWWR